MRKCGYRDRPPSFGRERMTVMMMMMIMMMRMMRPSYLVHPADQKKLLTVARGDQKQVQSVPFEETKPVQLWPEMLDIVCINSSFKRQLEFETDLY